VFVNAQKCLQILFAAAVITSSAVAIKGKAQAPHSGQNPPLQPTTSVGPKKAEEQFKNIQVLKGVPADDLIPTMQFITASLGVECDFCHEPKAFDKDDKKPKQIARKMMEMMFAINKDNFDGHREVTCYSCHRGNAKPLAIPAVMTEDTAASAAIVHPAEGHDKEITKGSGPTPDQLLDKYVQAIGGASAIDRISTRILKGTIEFGGKSFPIDIYCKAPDARISLTHMPEGDSVTAFNGHEGWLGMPGRPIREMRGSDLDGASIDADVHLATHLKEMFTEMRFGGTEKTGDHDTYEVIGQRTGKPPMHLYFDQHSGLLVRLVRYGDTALGWLPTQIEYADYREANGIQVPYRWTLARPSGRFTIQVNDLQQNVPVDDAKFVKPEPQHSPSHPSDKGNN
jgi:photosynthetic reaction center cytochrome c subunit